jgi:hypothetical protein
MSDSNRIDQTQPTWRDLEQIIDIKEYARLKSVSVDTIRRKIARSEGAPVIRLSPRRIGFRLRDVIAESQVA